jgi:hypothetical protein
MELKALIIIVVVAAALIVASVIDPLFFCGLLVGGLGMWYLLPKYKEWERLRRKQKIAAVERKLAKLKAED